MMQQSTVIANQYKMLYEGQRQTIISVEPILDKVIRHILTSISNDVKSQPNITPAYLKGLTETTNITGIWLIEKDEVIHLSSEGIQSTNAQEWYKTRTDVVWKEKLKWLLNNEGAIWVDTFSKRESEPYTYLKCGYIGLGNVPQLGGNVVLEVGMSTEDALSATEIENIMKDSKPVSKNIEDAKIIQFNPRRQQLSQGIKEYQKRDGYKVVTSIKAKDFDDDTQIILTTSFPELRTEVRGVLILAIGTTIFTLLCFGIILFNILGKPKNNWRED